MKVVYGLEFVATPPAHAVLTIGNFDGVHLAHRALLNRAKEISGETGGTTVVLTFEPHPLRVVAPHRAPRILTPLSEKLRLLDSAGADVAVVARSEAALLGLEAEEFIEQIVRTKLAPTHIVEGPSFGFGRGRRGTPELLKKAAAEFGCQVHVVDPVTVKLGTGSTDVVSSSLLRRLLEEGRVVDAARCLGRNYRVFGEVVRGDGRGRRLGFPTANLGAIDQVIPADGVYAGQAVVRGAAFRCAISIGSTPTFGAGVRRVEAHLLDFKDALYGESLAVDFASFLRDQATFSSPEALVRQLEQDVQAVRRLPIETTADAPARNGRAASNAKPAGHTTELSRAT
jgi:riboflavin kinase/FMN adenylyltransferase